MQSPNRAPAAPDGWRFGIESPSILRPIRVRSTLVFVIFLLLVVGVGAFSIGQLASFHSVSAQISGRWLQNSRILGDLNNYISNYCVVEGDFLIASLRADLRVAGEQIAMLDEAIATFQARYDKIKYSSPEREPRSQFVTQQNTYRKLARRLTISAKAGDVAGVTRLYHMDSKHAFDSASDTLGVMTERGAAGATTETEREAQAYHNARQLIVGATMVAAHLVVLAVTYLVYAVSHPTTALVDRMYRVASNDTQIDIPGVDHHDEIDDIVQAATRLRGNTIELGRSKDALIVQVVVLQETLDKERRMAELQRNPVLMASHEFRTPLGVTDDQAQRLIRMRDALPPEVLEERCEKIRAAVQRMTHLVDHLLDSPRWLDSTTSAAMRRTDFPLAAFLTEVREMHLEDTPSVRIELCVETDKSNISSGDVWLLFQAFNNLVGNTVKYSPLGAPVSVRMRSNGNGVSVTVEDRGLDIPECDIERLSERYVRGDNAAGTVGVGVRFYSVKLVMESRREMITVTSEEDKGLTFNAFLPRLKD